MLAHRTIRVVLGTDISNPRKLKNGQPQESVLAYLLFSLYIANIPETRSRKFSYADEWVLATRCKSFQGTEEILTVDLHTVGKKNTQHQIRKTTLAYNKTPNQYLGVTLDRTLSFKEHLSKIAKKLKSRNNVIQKLCGTTWGASASILRSSTLGLVFSTAEYCSSDWINSPHIHEVDAQLNHTMRIITGVIKSIPTQWLPVLSHIPPPKLRRIHSLTSEYRKILSNEILPIHQDIDATST
ncbi:uncharacterized protein [Diabrotica undecimpunctata]|uniref:uncharacterized protein n=1 Tax=Diabrotica undecimpunctata TaxID=50387 RepID=UPI003B638754